MGTYDLPGAARLQGRPVHPIQTYRALGRLTEAGMASQVESLSAYAPQQTKRRQTSGRRSDEELHLRIQ
jgi:Fe2+ or Zn2+ uptake regulation protein